MDSLLNKLYFILSQLNIDFEKIPKNFDVRKEVQKKLYLLQYLGIDFGYRYNLYLHGPYSPDLTEDSYSVESELDRLNVESSNLSLNSKGKNIIEEANQIINLSSDYGLTEIEWLELFTTLHYIYSEIFYSDFEKKEQIVKHLQEIKPQFSRRNNAIEKAWNIITNV